MAFSSSNAPVSATGVPLRRLVLITAGSLALSVLFFAPRLWLMQHYVKGSFQWDRAHTFLAQCEQPLRRDIEPAMDWRLLPPLAAHALHLPGNTLGHCGFFSEKYNLLFSGDMFASYFFNTHRPPPILNSAPEQLPASAEKIRQRQPRWLMPCHFDVLDGDLHRRRFAKLYGFADWETC